MTFPGFVRPDGRVGIRNHVLILSTVSCSRIVVNRIAEETGTVALTHWCGCNQHGGDRSQTERTLLNAARHPNVGAVLMVGLGCEQQQPARLAAKVTGKPVRWLTIQGEGGSSATVRRGIELVRELQEEISSMKRHPVEIDKLWVALDVGRDSARVEGQEISTLARFATEMRTRGVTISLGRASVLGACDPPPDTLSGQWTLLERLHERYLTELRWTGSPDENTAYRRSGELAGQGQAYARILDGIPVNGLLGWAEEAPDSGAWLVDTPNSGLMSVSGQIGGGAQVAVVVGEEGGGIGSPLAPVVRVGFGSGSPMAPRDFFDAVLDDREGSSRNAGILRSLLISVAAGQETQSELLGEADFAIARLGSTM